MAIPEERWRPGEQLTDLEQLMLDCAASGEDLEATPGTMDHAIRAGVLRYLLAHTDWAVDPKGVRLRGLRISGLLDLQAVRVRCPLWMEECVLDASWPVTLDLAEIPQLTMSRCQLPGISADSLTVKSNLSLKNSRISGPVNLSGASTGNGLICTGAEFDGPVVLAGMRIGGAMMFGGARIGAAENGNSLVCNGMNLRLSAHLWDLTTDGDAARIGTDPNGNSLICDGIRTGGSVDLDATAGAAFTADGAVRLAGAQITGSLSCRDARLGVNHDQNSLEADEIKVTVAVLLDRLGATGAIRLAGAEIAGQLSGRGVQVTGTDRDGSSLAGTEIRIGGSAYLDNGFSSVGAVDLSGADVGGLLSLAGAIIGPDKFRCALACDGIRAARDVVADDGNFGGWIRLPGAVIGGSFLCRDTRLSASSEHFSLTAARARVGGDMLLDRIDAAGSLLVAGATIGGRFCCRGASLKGADANGDALSARGLTTGGSVLLTQQFTAAGAVQLTQATIGGSLHCSTARLEVADGARALTVEQANVTGAVLLDRGFVTAGTVSLRAASITRELCWEPGRAPGGEVNLEGTHTQQLTDNWAGSRSLGYWPATRLRIAGFSYDSFGGDHTASAEQRLAWIRSQYAVHPGHAQAASAFATQPYKQLAGVYRRAGQEDEARTVEIAMRRDVRAYGTMARPAWLLNWVFDVTIRYGFQTARALAGLVGLYIVVLAALLLAQHQGTLIEASNIQNASLHPTALHCVTGYPCFYPAGYAFDLVVPLVNIHQAEFWQVNGHHWLGWLWVLGSWTATALGWFLATLLVVGYTGLARQQ
jgi:hypothetical protein